MVVTDGDGGHFVFFRRRRHRYLDHPHAQQGVDPSGSPRTDARSSEIAPRNTTIFGD